MPTPTLVSHLIENAPTRIHEDSVIERLLTIRHTGCTTIPVFDPSWPISTHLVRNCRYELIIVVSQLRDLHYPTDPFEGLQLGVWRGLIVDPAWTAPEAAYRYTRPTLYRHSGKKRVWVLAATPIGMLLLDRGEVRTKIGFAVEAGDYVQWYDGQFDLYAVV